jgi:hypothetical protein
MWVLLVIKSPFTIFLQERERYNSLLSWKPHGTSKVKVPLIELHFNCQVVSSLVIACCYVGVSGTTQQGIQDIRGVLWLMTSEVCFNLSYSALYAFEGELPIFKREVGNYSCSAYFMSRFLSYVSIFGTLLLIL